MKIVGCASVMIGFYLIGAYFSFKPYFRKEDLLEMKRAIIQLKSELNYMSSIGEAISNIENGINKNVKGIFTSFKLNLQTKRGEELHKLWNDAIDNHSNKTYLTTADKEKLSLVGRVISSMDKNFSVDILNMVIEYVDISIKLIDEEQRKNTKMYQSLGVLSGIAVIILLM